MSEASPMNAAIISIRIVHIDHYQQPLQNYSSSLSFQAARLTYPHPPKLPVIRIFGSTPAKQRACLHIHGTRPYLYLPLIPGAPAETLARAREIRDTLERALHSAFPDDDEQARVPFIADVEPVLKYDVYGYHPSKSVFLKVSTFVPQTVSRIASIVSQRGVPHLTAPLPYASHIPFVMQFLVDYSLSGMDYIHLSHAKFRSPLPEHAVAAERVFSRPSANRRFVAGLDKIKPDLFWPFSVAKRSSSELELDAFPEHILNAKFSEPENPQYSFMSRTLSVLWEEERFRTGEYPPRKMKVDRPVKAGAAQTDKYMRERLEEVCNRSSSQGSERARDVSGDAHCFRDEDPQDDDGRIEQQNATQSYDEVLRFLDASSSFPSVEDNVIEQFDDEDEPAVLRAEKEEMDVEEDGEGIERTWADIADCTQHESAADDDRIKSETVRRLDEEGTQPPASVQRAQRIQKSPSATLSFPIRVHRNTPTQPMNKPSKKRPRASSLVDERVVISSFEDDDNEKKDDSLVVGSNPVTHSNDQMSSDGKNNDHVVEHVDEDKHVDIKPDIGAPLFVVCPATKAPSHAYVAQKMPSTGALSITYNTPFYGEEKDEVKTTEVFGGKLIPVRGSGANGYPPFPSFFDGNAEGKIVEVMPRTVCPVEKPPSTFDLRLALTKRTKYARERSTAGMVIDSAGRQVQRRSQGQTWEQLTCSAGERIGHLGGTQDVSDLARALEEEEYSTPSSSLDRGKRTTEFTTPTRENIDDLEYNRPLSPKYDEAYQITRNNMHDSARKSHGLNETPKSAAKPASDKSNRNSTLSLSESLHRHQNVTVMSIEILAACYSGKLPDPAQNGLLAVAVITKTDEEGSMSESNVCIIFVVKKSLRLEPHYAVVAFDTETALLDGLAGHMRSIDPDVIVGYETQNSSIGYILERSHAIGHPFQSSGSRWLKGGSFDPSKAGAAGTSNHAAAVYYHRKGADIKISGRHVLSLWRIVRKEVKLSSYSREAVASELFGMTFPKHNGSLLEAWFCSGQRFGRAIRHLARQAYLDLAIVDKLDILSRTGELARVFGIDFMSVMTRGSQYRVESMMRRVSRARDFVLLAAPREEVFRQPAVEALPLVMEPQSALYVDPVIVLDFQSLYPSVIIGHNLCFSTMLGNVNRVSSWGERRRIGVRPQYDPPSSELLGFPPSEHVFVASNGEMFIDSSVRRGILPVLLEEILETRVMVKTAMKGIVGDEATANMLNARQFGLKMIANVTYGYTSASFSGRMPCSGLADAIVQCGRDSLEEIIRYVEEELRPDSGATVVYGDTDSLFVQVPGATRDEAFDVGEQIVAHAAKIFPDPITLKLEKVYQPSIMQTKKRYVGYSYESRTQAVPIFDAKGIETVRRDSCPLVQKALERAIRLLFETKDVSRVKRQIQRLCYRLHQDRIPFADYIFRKEVRLGSYKEGHLPPAAIVATKAMERDARNVPRHGERVAFVVLYERPGAPLKDCVISPEDFLASGRQGVARLNTTYYITKQILPALNRIFSLIGVRVGLWYAEMPRPTFGPIAFAKDKGQLRAKQSSLTMFYATEKCVICHGKGVGQQMCRSCVEDEGGMQAARFVVADRQRDAEQQMVELLRTCLTCVGDRADIGCGNLICSVHDARLSVERQIDSLRFVLDDESIWKPS